MRIESGHSIFDLTFFSWYFAWAPIRVFRVFSGSSSLKNLRSTKHTKYTKHCRSEKSDRRAVTRIFLFSSENGEFFGYSLLKATVGSTRAALLAGK